MRSAAECLGKSEDMETASGSAPAPVPGIIFSGGNSESIRKARSSSFSATVSELASELVPNTASPAPCDRIQPQNLTNSGASGFRDLSNGVRTGAKTPARLSWAMRMSVQLRAGMDALVPAFRSQSKGFTTLNDPVPKG